MKKILAAVLLGLLLSAIAPAQAQNNLNLGVVNNGLSSFLPDIPIYIDARVLAATVNESHTVPTGARYVIFSSTCAAWYAKRGGTAAVPAADVTDGTASDLNPSGYRIPNGVTAIGFISPTACIVTMRWHFG